MCYLQNDNFRIVKFLVGILVFCIVFYKIYTMFFIIYFGSYFYYILLINMIISNYMKVERNIYGYLIEVFQLYFKNVYYSLNYNFYLIRC